MTSWLVACDLDQTLIYSRRAFRLPADAAAPPLVIAEYLDGEPLSYLTRRAFERLGQLAAAVPVMPVTTRTLAQYGRVQLGFQPRYAIAANGGHLLVDGVPDPQWETLVRQRVAASGWSLEAVRARAQAIAEAGGWVRTVRDADGFFAYLVATERAAIPDLRDLEAELAAAGWTLSIQGRKVYLVPRQLTKEAAIAEVVRRTGTAAVVAAGDSLLDLGMLRAADAAVRPAHGELHEQRAELATMTVTSHAGLLAGEDVVELLHTVVTGSSDAPQSELGSAVRSG